MMRAVRPWFRPLLLALAAVALGLIGLGLLRRAAPPATDRADEPPPGEPRERVARVTLAGVVVDERGQPLASARVRAQLQGAAAGPAQAVASTASDSQGKFELEVDASAGPVELLASHPEHVDGALSRVEVRARADLRIELERAGALHGTVIDPGGKPAAGAKVRVSGSGLAGGREVTSDARGRFAVAPLPAGVYEASAELGEAVALASEGISVESGSEAWVALQLQPGGTLEVRVTEAASGAPVPGAQLLLEQRAGGPPRPLGLDGDGRTQVAGLQPVPQRVFVQAPGYVPRAGVAVPGGAALELVLQKAARITGLVLDESGAPVEGAELELLAEGGGESNPALVSGLLPGAGENLGVTLGTIPKVPLLPPVDGAMRVGLPSIPGMQAPAAWRSDAEGRFVLEPVMAGTLRVVARHPRFAPGQSEAKVVAAGASLSDLRLTVLQGGTIAGQVLDASGEPAPGVRVDLSLPGDTRSTLSDSDGAFELQAVRGQGKITARPPGEPPVEVAVTVAPGAEVPVTLQLQGESAALAGEVLGAAGEPLVAAVVRVVTLESAPQIARTTVTDTEGRFSVPGLPAGSCRLEIEHPEHVPLVLTVSPGGEPLHLLMARGARLRVTVRDAFTGEALPGTALRLRPDKAGVATSVERARRSGDVEIRGVNEGNYTLIAQHPGFASGVLAVLVPPGSEDLDLGVVELVPAGVVTGTVVDRYGSAVAGAQVVSGQPARWTRSVRTDVRGEFRLSDLPEGEHWVTARASGAGTSEAERVRVQAGEETSGAVLRLPEAWEPAVEAGRPAAAARRAAEPAAAQAASGGENERPGADDPDAELTSGVAVSVGYADGAVRIESVRGEAARAAGLRPGDALRAIEGESVLAAAQARALLRGTPGTRVQLEIERGGKTQRLRVARESYVP